MQSYVESMIMRFLVQLAELNLMTLLKNFFYLEQYFLTFEKILVPL
jgi:hypothetical protein